MHFNIRSMSGFLSQERSSHFFNIIINSLQIDIEKEKMAKYTFLGPDPKMQYNDKFLKCGSTREKRTLKSSNPIKTFCNNSEKLEFSKEILIQI